MNVFLFVGVIGFFSYLVWEQRNTYISIYIPSFKKRKKKQDRVFKTFRFIETKNGVRCYEESRLRAI